MNPIKDMHAPGPGRPVGSQNKATGRLREIIGDILEENLERIRDDIQAMKPRDRARLFVDLLQYAVPRLAATDTKVKISQMSSEELDELLEKIIEQ